MASTLHDVLRYLGAIVKVWVFWAWAPILDLLGLVIDTFVPDFDPPRWLYWFIAGAGYVVANIKLYVTLQRTLDDLENQEALLDLQLTERGDFQPPSVSAVVPPPFRVEQDYAVKDRHGWRRDGLPGWASLWAAVVVKNLGDDPRNRLVCEIDWDLTYLPKVFVLEDPQESVYFKGSIQDVAPSTDGYKHHWFCYVKIASAYRTPETLAQALNPSEKYKITLRYWTERVHGRSKVRSLTLEGDMHGFCQKLAEDWSLLGHPNLAERIAGSG